MKNKISENPKEFILKKSSEISGKNIEGYDFSKGNDFKKIVESFGSTGFQASHFSKAVEIINEMISEKSKIFLGFTSNIISSGLRDVIRFLVEKKKVDVLVTTGGGIEEDMIKCLGNFVLGDFKAEGKKLREKAINRIGNIFVPNSRYIKFEEFVMPVLEECYEEQKKTGKIFTPSDLIWKLGEKINNEKSIYYWAWKNQIRVYSYAILDGSFGDMVYFFKSKHEDFLIDISNEMKMLNDETSGLRKSGLIVLGTGTVKHSILNAHLYRNGADFAVFVNNSQEFDGSDAGANPDEAVSWGKIKPQGKAVKIFGDATMIFPLLVAETFAK
ncbi:deoxyhypusine synthase [Candidatus Pacearchaeota archaeon]|nr:deoxyhypusine synthase [Candidatus Pacearchaeota archaeon]